MPFDTLKMPIGTFKVPNDTPKVPNGTYHVPRGMQPLYHTLIQLHAILCSQAFFFKDCLTFKKIFFFGVKLRHSDMSNSLAFKNHHLHHYFQKLIKSSFFLRLMVLCSKLGAFAHGSFIFKKEKKIIITKISKNYAFIVN